jgi:hypothetical protein
MRVKYENKIPSTGAFFKDNQKPAREVVYSTVGYRLTQ